ncbi:MAG: hypothetical protein GVY08_00735 [Bacteroidetes bacterium]|jgi:hypothetical protein|nr:hypothetical protein [Bacteroidota bacterium]
MAIPQQLTINEFKEKFEGAKTVIHEYGTLDSDTVIFKLNPETWSCTEVCQHLIRFNELYLAQMKKGIEHHTVLPVSKRKQTFSPKWSVRKLAGYLEPPYKMAIKTIKPMYPSKVELSAADTFHRLIEIQDELIDLLQTAENEEWNIDEIKAPHPLIRFYEMSLTDFIVFIDAHQRRHFWQIEQILKRIPE